MLKRALANAGKLLGGKGAAGVMQLATFAIAARVLGLQQFGLFSVMLAQIQLLIGLATFQSSQAIVRYGVLHLNEENRAGFQALAKFGTALDYSAAAVASLIAFVAAPIVADAAGWGHQFVSSAQLLALLPLTNAISTPKGMLRLFGRFDLLAHQTVITPLARLVGTIAVAVSGGGLFELAAIWLFAGLAGSLAAMFLAWREAARRDLLSGIKLSMRRAAKANPGIWRFSLLANLHSSLVLLPAQTATLAAGVVLGANAAGLVKVAQEIGTALAKPIDLINQTVYPDIARLAAERSWPRLRKLIFRSGITAAAVGVAITLLLALVGRQVIGLVFGPEFAPAFLLLLLISAATAITVSMFAVDPTLYAMGRPSRPMLTALGVDTVFLAAMFAAFASAGVLAPGIGYIAGAVVAVLMSIYWLDNAVPRARS